jgi:hypothetical protein
VGGSPQQQHASDEHGATGGSTVGALMQPLSWESDIPQELIDDLMLISERMQEFQDSFKDLYRFYTISTLNFPHFLLLSSLLSQTFSQCQTDHGQSVTHQVGQIAGRGE